MSGGRGRSGARPSPRPGHALTARGRPHNLSHVSTSALVILGFRLSRRAPTERYPYGLERAEDLAGVGIAMVTWVSAAFAGYESVRRHGCPESRSRQPARHASGARSSASRWRDAGPARPRVWRSTGYLL